MMFEDVRIEYPRVVSRCNCFHKEYYNVNIRYEDILFFKNDIIFRRKLDDAQNVSRVLKYQVTRIQGL